MEDSKQSLQIRSKLKIAIITGCIAGLFALTTRFLGFFEPIFLCQSFGISCQNNTQLSRLTVEDGEVVTLDVKFLNLGVNQSVTVHSPP